MDQHLLRSILPEAPHSPTCPRPHPWSAPNKPVHYSNSSPVSVFCFWVQQLSKPNRLPICPRELVGFGLCSLATEAVYHTLLNVRKKPRGFRHYCSVELRLLRGYPVSDLGRNMKVSANIRFHVTLVVHTDMKNCHISKKNTWGKSLIHLSGKSLKSDRQPYS